MYVAEARKKDGTPFLPKSLYLLLTGLLHKVLTSQLWSFGGLDEIKDVLPAIY